MPEGTFINAALSVDLVAFVLAVMLAWTVKYAFIDSWIMVKMMHGYMQVAPTTVITFDLYTKLSGLSSNFKRLFNESHVTPDSVAFQSSVSVCFLILNISSTLLVPL